MKDTFGGTIMIYILIFFLGIYIVFIALTLRYAQSFKLKNKTIELIEQYNGEVNSNSFEDALSYYFEQNKGLKPKNLDVYIVNNDDKRKTCYYEVHSYIDWKWPFLGIEGTWDIHGETKNVDNCPSESGKVTLNLGL